MSEPGFTLRMPRAGRAGTTRGILRCLLVDTQTCFWGHKGGKLNVSENCVDRHLAERGDQVALIWEADEPTDGQQITFKELHENVCRMANVLKSHGVGKGDRVCLYMPMTPAIVYAMLACARIGAVHSIVFAG